MRKGERISSSSPSLWLELSSYESLLFELRLACRGLEEDGEAEEAGEMCLGEVSPLFGFGCALPPDVAEDFRLSVP